MWLLERMFAGVWPLVFHWGLGIGVIIILVVLSYASETLPLIGPHLNALRKDLRWGAVGIAIFLFGMWVGDRDRANRYEAQVIVLEKHVTSTVKAAKSPAALAKPDKFNSKDN